MQGINQRRRWIVATALLTTAGALILFAAAIQAQWIAGDGFTLVQAGLVGGGDIGRTSSGAVLAGRFTTMSPQVMSAPNGMVLDGTLLNPQIDRNAVQDWRTYE